MKNQLLSTTIIRVLLTKNPEMCAQKENNQPYHSAMQVQFEMRHSASFSHISVDQQRQSPLEGAGVV